MTKPAPVYVLGGAQTDFARNWSKRRQAFRGDDARGDFGRARSYQNRAARSRDRSRRQLRRRALRQARPYRRVFRRNRSDFSGLPTSRHEAACASGSIALIAASAEIEAQRYDLSCVVGRRANENCRFDHRRRLPRYRGVGVRSARPRESSSRFLNCSAASATNTTSRYGLKDEHLAHISAVNYSNAKRNPNAQTRNWFMSESHAQHESKIQPGHRRPDQSKRLLAGHRRFGRGVFLRVGEIC